MSANLPHDRAEEVAKALAMNWEIVPPTAKDIAAALRSYSAEEVSAGLSGETDANTHSVGYDGLDRAVNALIILLSGRLCDSRVVIADALRSYAAEETQRAEQAEAKLDGEQSAYRELEAERDQILFRAEKAEAELAKLRVQIYNQMNKR